MLVAVNAFLINSNDHVYRSRMTLMDREYQLEQTPRLLMQVFWGINDTFRICICILLDSDCPALVVYHHQSQGSQTCNCRRQA